MAPSNPNPLPRNLDVKKFAASRSRELESLHSVISVRLNHDFKIRRNKRRRTTDFRSSKKKRRIRKDSDSGPDPNRKPSRRVRRSSELRSNPDSGFVRSGDGTKRLRTHVWHAKRFTMVKRWGFYLPLGMQGRGRGSRAVLRWSESGALVHDASYWHPIQLEGPENSILAILRMVLLPLPSSDSDEISHSVKYGVCYKNAMLYKDGTPYSQFIAPVSYMWRPFLKEEKFANTENDHGKQNCIMSSRQLWIWIHAAASEEGLDSLKAASQKQMHESGVSVSCTSLEGRIARLDVMGSKTIQIIQKILDPMSETCSKYDDFLLSSYLTPYTNSQLPNSFALQHAEHLPCHAILSLIVRDPRDFSSTASEADLENTTSLQQNWQENDTQSLNPTISTASTSCEDDIVALWSKPEANGGFISESKLLWDSNEKLNPPLPEDILCRKRHQKRLKHFCIDATDDEKLVPEAREGFDQFCSILLLKHANKGNFNIGCSIVLPLSWVKAFWNSLIFHGAHAIGLREMRWLASTSGLPCFPYDFPDCKAYSSFMADEAITFDDSAERRPLAVRPSRVPIPPPWDCIQSTCKHGFEELNNDSIQMPDLQLYSSQTSEPSSSEQSGSLFNGFVLRISDGLGEYMEKIDHGGSSYVAGERGPCFVRVLVRAFKEGVFEEGAVVCAPIIADLPRWESRLENDKFEIPQSLIRSYFTQLDSGKWELELPSSIVESYR